MRKEEVRKIVPNIKGMGTNEERKEAFGLFVDETQLENFEDAGSRVSALVSARSDARATRSSNAFTRRSTPTIFER